jgi:hypothetical protein
MMLATTNTATPVANTVHCTWEEVPGSAAKQLDNWAAGVDYLPPWSEETSPHNCNPDGQNASAHERTTVAVWHTEYCSKQCQSALTVKNGRGGGDAHWTV